eukprot:CAMPEP_0178401938 /NCGR_PEP_ID=MMETSP0689_2-20121128/16574_1 /TAXON_ID=160604 /ORGANISM="Amphidinium massartii, Strain CS-259" /LENGTH=448 /DNA_ID=CAMNT_0020022803 /DNA_START=122 /DNA_END=1468 /DNA_ORIENTATION=+
MLATSSGIISVILVLASQQAAQAWQEGAPPSSFLTLHSGDTEQFIIEPPVSMASSFVEYKETYARSYSESSQEHQMRQSIYADRMQRIDHHNSRSDKLWKAGVNHFTDRTSAELQRMRGYKRTEEDLVRRGPNAGKANSLAEGQACTARNAACQGEGVQCCDGLVCGAKGQCEASRNAPTDAFDWSDSLPTSFSIVDQGACGSCWAMTATAAVQMQAVLLSNNSYTSILSPQSMVGCTPNERKCGGTGGCDGSTAELGFQWAAQNGLSSIDLLEYHADSSCPTKSFLQRSPSVKIDGYVRLPDNKPDQVMKALVTAGPLAVAVVADELHFYKTGIFDCSHPSGQGSSFAGAIDESRQWIVDHAVLMMGYGKENGVGYWKIRNSWGNNWGEKGFFRLRRHYPDQEEPCGWDNDPQKGVGCQGGPNRLWVCGACGVYSDVAYPINARPVS